MKFNDMTDIRYPRELYFVGIRLQQSWTTLFLLEDIFNKEKDISTFVELGTGYGALALFAGLHLKDRGQVLTLDLENKLTMRYNMLAHPLRIWFTQADILDPTTVAYIRRCTSSYRSIIFCDAGEQEIRSKQFHIYAAILKPHDIIMIHDYHNSITDQDISDIPNLEPYRQQDFDSLHTYILSRIKT